MTSPQLFTLIRIIFLGCMVLAGEAASQGQHAIALYGKPKYEKGFDHFAYVNPRAPKGGDVRIGAIGVFDSLNPYSFKGIPAAGTGVLGPSYVFDTLMISSEDEPETLYGLVAESIEVAPDRSWIIFTLNKLAKWPDGKPITSADVKFTLETLQEHGRPYLQSHYKKVISIEILGPDRIKFILKPIKDIFTDQEVYERDLPLILGRLVVLPKHIMEGKDFHKLTQKDIMRPVPTNKC